MATGELTLMPVISIDFPLMADENTSATDVPVVDLSKTCFMLAMSLSRLLGFLDFWISVLLRAKGQDIVRLKSVEYSCSVGADGRAS
jgi:hypothetical protein